MLVLLRYVYCYTILNQVDGDSVLHLDAIASFGINWEWNSDWYLGKED